jgi:hypothetical protein
MRIHTYRLLIFFSRAVSRFSMVREMFHSRSAFRSWLSKVIPVHLFHSELSVLHRIVLILGRRVSH